MITISIPLFVVFATIATASGATLAVMQQKVIEYAWENNVPGKAKHFKRYVFLRNLAIFIAIANFVVVNYISS